MKGVVSSYIVRSTLLFIGTSIIYLEKYCDLFNLVQKPIFIFIFI